MASRIAVRRSIRNKPKAGESTKPELNGTTGTRPKITTSSADDPENRPRTRAATNRQAGTTTGKAASSTVQTTRTRVAPAAARMTRSRASVKANDAAASSKAKAVETMKKTTTTTNIKRGALVEVTKKLTNKEKKPPAAAPKGKGKAKELERQQEEPEERPPAPRPILNKQPPRPANDAAPAAPKTTIAPPLPDHDPPPRVFSKPPPKPGANPEAPTRRIAKRPSGEIDEGHHRPYKRRHTDEEEAAAERRRAERRVRDAERLREILAEEERHKEEMMKLLMTDDSLCEAGEVENELIFNVPGSDDYLTEEQHVFDEDEMLEDWDDIDKEDEDDPAMVTEYAAEAFELLREKEMETLPNPNYMDGQTELKWETRSILVDWLIQVHSHCRLLPETLFLTINLLDRFLSKRPVSVAKFQLVGLATLFIASKFEETYAPGVQEMIDFTGGTYSREELIKAERFILRTLNWALCTYPGPMSFLRRCSRADGTEMKARTVGKYLCEVGMSDWRMIATQPSLMAAAGMWLGRLTMGREVWTANMRKYSGYREKELMATVGRMIEWLVRPGNEPVAEPEGEFGTLLKKYASRKFMKASIFMYQWAIERFKSGCKITEADMIAQVPRLKAEVREERERLAALERERSSAGLSEEVSGS